MNNITLLLPTCNREDYLRRWIEAYRDYNFNVFILDGSNKKFTDSGNLPKSIVYYHFPNTMPKERINSVLDDISSDYCILCADDDFIFPLSLKKASTFLTKNKDYSCAHGHIISFEYYFDKKVIDFNDILLSKNLTYIYKKYIVNSDDMTKRLIQYSEPYKCLTWGLCRTKDFKIFFRGINKFSIREPYMIELTFAMFLCIQGKIKELDYLFNLKEFISHSDTSKYKNIPTLVKINDDSYIQAKKFIYSLIKKKNLYTEQEIENIIDNSFNSFLNFYPKFIKKLKDKSNHFHELKRHLPRIIWIIYRKINSYLLTLKLIKKDIFMIKIIKLIKKYNINPR